MINNIKSLQIDLSNRSSIRALLATILVVLFVNWIISKICKLLIFRNKINKLPGPATSNLLLGNIPSDALSLLTSSDTRSAANFYTGQIQSLLGHTLIYRDYDLFRVWIGQEPVVCIWKPEMVERVLGDNFLLEKSYHYDYLKPWLGDGLLTSSGNIWRFRRRLLGPSFHFNILQSFVPVFDRKSRFLVRKINKLLYENEMESKSVVLDITPLITACTLDAICETIMGVSVDAQEKPNNDYCRSVHIAGETFLERIIQPKYWLEFIFRTTKLGKLYKFHLEKLHKFTRSVISERKKENNENEEYKKSFFNDRKSININQSMNESSLIDRMKVIKDKSSYRPTQTTSAKLPKAFLDLLLDYKKSDGTQTLTDEEIREEVDTFMFEGHDTTAMALSWALFLLGHNLDVQKKLANEIDEFYARNNLDYDDDNNTDDFNDKTPYLDEIKQLKYLDCVIKEALRLCPSIPIIGRKTTKDITIGKHEIPAGTVLFILIYQLHRDIDMFPKPEKFDPDRFSLQNASGRHPFAFVPFSAGARNCIGQKFAMTEMKTILINLVRRFKFESVTPMCKTKVQMEMVLRPKCNIDIRISPRPNTNKNLD